MGVELFDQRTRGHVQQTPALGGRLAQPEGRIQFPCGGPGLLLRCPHLRGLPHPLEEIQAHPVGIGAILPAEPLGACVTVVVAGELPCLEKPFEVGRRGAHDARVHRGGDRSLPRLASRSRVVVQLVDLGRFLVDPVAMPVRCLEGGDIGRDLVQVVHTGGLEHVADGPARALVEALHPGVQRVDVGAVGVQLHRVKDPVQSALVARIADGGCPLVQDVIAHGFLLLRG